MVTSAVALATGKTCYRYTSFQPFRKIDPFLAVIRSILAYSLRNGWKRIPSVGLSEALFEARSCVYI